MLSSHKHPTIELGLSAAAAFGAYELDHYFGVHSNEERRVNPIFHTSRPDDAEKTLGVLPGCQIDGKRYFDSLGGFVTDANLVVVEYPEHGFDTEQICEGMANQLLFAKAERPSLLCTSMGGIVMRDFLNYCEDYDITDKLGGFGTIVLDSSPFDGHDIKPAYRALLTAAGVAKNSRLLDAAKRFSMRTWNKSNMSADAHLDTIYAEGEYIDAASSPQPLPDIMDMVYYVAAANDSVINTDQAAEKYVKIAPYGKFQYFTDYNRPARMHTARMQDFRFELNLMNLRKEPVETDIAA